MLTEKRRLGDEGEEAAAKYLRKNGYRIRERNFVTGKHEIDIIAENMDCIVFVEVKSRTYSHENEERFGRPCMAVNYTKQCNIISAARSYLSKIKIQKHIRLDVIEVYFDNHTPPRLLSVHHMPDAFRIRM